MSTSLADQACVPCRGGVPPMAQDRAKELLRELDEGWLLNAEGHLEREYRLEDFAWRWPLPTRWPTSPKQQSHHPDLSIAWGKCKVEIWTHKIRGLTESDFFFAAKADRAFGAMDGADALSRRPGPSWTGRGSHPIQD